MPRLPNRVPATLMAPGLAALIAAGCSPGTVAEAGPAAADTGDPAGTPAATTPRAARGFEHPRQADLGDCTFLNPILAGDHPDPSVLRVGYHHNVAGMFLSLRPGLHAAGEGRVRFLDYRYRALD